jgi:hypothetical protein
MRVVNLIDRERSCLTGEKLMSIATSGKETLFMKECISSVDLLGHINLLDQHEHFVHRG